MNPFLIKTAEACSIQYNEPIQKSFHLKSLIIKQSTGGASCTTYTTISPFALVIISGMIIYVLIKKIKTVQRKWVKFFGWVFIIILILFFLVNVPGSVALFI